MEHLPPGKIPAACKHLDVLKNILNACAQLSFQREYVHVSAHQDEVSDFHSLSRPEQLNCAVDAGAKRRLVAAIEKGNLAQMAFPLEPIVCFVGDHKITPDGAEFSRFWIQKQLARMVLSDLKILSHQHFDKIAWRHVHMALDGVPRMFQVWACKQVMGIANTNATVNKWDKEVEAVCPSCRQAAETTEHVLMCMEAGMVDIFLRTVDLLE